MEETLILLSQLKEESSYLCELRLNAYHLLLQDTLNLVSFEERDDMGFGVLENLAHDKNMICQYGTLTTFVQLNQQALLQGIIVGDLFDEMPLHHKEKWWTKLSLYHQAYTNAGVYIYVPESQHLDLHAYFVKDNSVQEDVVKSIFIVKGKNASVNFSYEELSFGQSDNVYQLEIVEIDEIA